MIRHRWEHHEISGWGGFDCSCSRASLQENHQYHAHRRRALFLEAKVAVGKNKATKASKAIDNWKGSVQRKVLVERGPRFRCAIRCVHRKGAPDRKPTPNAETWESRSALATRHRRQHVQRMFGTSTRSGFRRGCGPASCAHPQTLLTRSTFPVRYPVRAPERGPRWQTHAQRRNLGISVRVDQVHVSGALSGACTGKGPQMANPRLTPKPGNLGPPWPPGTSGDPAGYSRGRPLGGSRLSLVRSGSPGADAARL